MNIEELLHDTTRPYRKIKHRGIEYTVCAKYDHISRYQRLRQVIHYERNNEIFKTLEIQNYYDYDNVHVEYYQVTVDRENRLDLISYDYYGTTAYSWIIAYINGIEDNYTVWEGQTLMIPIMLTDLFTSGCVLSAVAPTALNLGTE